MDDDPTDLAGRLRGICLAFPEVTERPSHGAPTWFVRGKSSFVTLWAGLHLTCEFSNASGPLRNPILKGSLLFGSTTTLHDNWKISIAKLNQEVNLAQLASDQPGAVDHPDPVVR